MLCYSQEGLCASLTTLPSEALQTEALKLFKVIWEWSLVIWVPKLSLAQLDPITAQENSAYRVAPGLWGGRESPTWFPLWLLYGRNITLLQPRKKLWGSRNYQQKLSLEELPPTSSNNRRASLHYSGHQRPDLVYSLCVHSHILA